jgi:type VI secretion system protein ImpM
MNRRTEISGWYGKLPGAGDFAARGLPAQLQEQLESWIGNGLIQFRHRSPDWSHLFTLASTWAMLIPRGIFCESALVGCIAPSRDRVGRLYPIVALQNVSQPDSASRDLPPHSHWHSDIAALIGCGQSEQWSAEAFDDAFLNQRVKDMQTVRYDASQNTNEGDIYAVLGASGENVSAIEETTIRLASTAPSNMFGFSWPELDSLFDPVGTRSYWWTLGGHANKRIAHDGRLTSHLFITLFSLALNARSA